MIEFLEKVEQSGQWPQQACTTIFFLIPKNVTSERPIAHLPTLIRWQEVLRAPQVAKWQLKYRVDWDAADGSNGGAQQTVWEILMEMFKLSGSGRRSGSGDCGVGAGEGLRASQSPCGVCLGDAPQLPKEDPAAGALWVLRAPEASAV